MQQDDHQTLPPPQQPLPQPPSSQGHGTVPQVSTDQTASQAPQQSPSQAAEDIVVTPDTAHDSDLIEKDWVNKTKDVVERSKRDPYRLNQEIAKLRADYMKKRYNISIKVSED